jgi:hypothetical protein
MKIWYEHVPWKRLSLWILLAAAVGYVSHDFGWKSVIAVVAALFGVIGIEFAEFRQRVESDAARPQVRKHDRDLLQQLMELLPSEGVIKFINDHNMAGFSFEREELHPIDSFLAEWNNAQHEFVDVDVEHAKQELLQACQAWSRTIGTETFSMSNGRRSVPAEWEIEQPDRFERVVNQLHTQAQAIVDTHERLMRIGTRRLME